MSYRFLDFRHSAAKFQEVVVTGDLARRCSYPLSRLLRAVTSVFASTAIVLRPGVTPHVIGDRYPVQVKTLEWLI